jgi:hypothetical protein
MEITMALLTGDRTSINDLRGLRSEINRIVNGDENHKGVGEFKLYTAHKVYNLVRITADGRRADIVRASTMRECATKMRSWVAGYEAAKEDANGR